MKRAFTLIELLVVIAIIAILAALLFPTFAQAKRAAKTTTGLSNAKGMATAFLLYAGDSDDAGPLVTEGESGEGREGGWTFNVRFPGADRGTFDHRRGSLFPYVKNAGIYRVPNDPDGDSSLSFAVNGCLLRPPLMAGINAPRSFSEAERPSGTMLIGEEATGYGRHATNDGFFHPRWDYFGEWNPGARTLVAYVDGHAKSEITRGRYETVLHGLAEDCWGED